MKNTLLIRKFSLESVLYLLPLICIHFLTSLLRLGISSASLLISWPTDFWLNTLMLYYNIFRFKNYKRRDMVSFFQKDTASCRALAIAIFSAICLCNPRLWNA